MQLNGRTFFLPSFPLRPARNRDHPARNRDRLLQIEVHPRTQSRFVAGQKNNKSGAERGAKCSSRPGPRTKVNTMSKKDISKKKWPDPLKLKKDSNKNLH